MHTPPSLPLTFLAVVLPTVGAITLSSFQPINGFSTACVNAYNTPLSGCTASDFSSGDCSTSCIEFLDSLTNVLNAECQGSSTYPDTLVGAFFQGEGTSTLCPNVMGQGSGGGGGSASSATDVLTASASSYTHSTVQATTSTIIATKSVSNVMGQGSGGGGGSASSATDVLTASASLYTHSTVQATTSTIIATKSVSTATSSTTSAASTTTSQVILSAAVTPNSPSPLRSTITAQPKSSTSRSSSSTSTSSSSGGGGNGGGTILDVGSSSASHNAKIEAWVLFLLAGSAGLVWLL